MPSPFKHPKTGVYWLRLRVPRDLRSAVGRGELRRSLRTKDPAEAKRLFPAALQAIQREWQRLRRAPEPLSPQQVSALAGQLYRETVEELGGQAFDAPVWSTIGSLNERLSAASPERLEGWFGPDADRLLSEAGLHAEPANRRRLLEALLSAHAQAAEVCLRRAEGDFTPDPRADRFPSKLAPQAAPAAASSVTLTGLLDLWKREHSAAGGSASTAKDWERIIGAFIKHLGGDRDAAAVSPKDVSGFADHLRHERKLSAKTINGRYLAAIGSIYRLGIRKHLLDKNPAERVEVSADKPRQVRSKGFTEGEAKAVLSAALRSADPALRWLPLIAAYTGARIGELVQLRRDDFGEEGKIAFVRISPEGGSVKTGIYRDVPLHPYLLDLGLLAFVKGRKPGRLFPSNSAQRIARFVRRVLDLPAGRGLSPNHAWRHRFKTIAREAGLDLRAADAIQGHADGSASGGYGEWTVRALHRELVKLPALDQLVEAALGDDDDRLVAPPALTRRNSGGNPTALVFVQPSGMQLEND